ncbi:GNAT family N-acetyltransferase [Gangjinia marincola]|uniref:GNAT family N-acetyltransferase n=1 Tax=Gangjinia marincola TaxID=578463 RepID=A0ABN1MET8_9FLAO
MAHRIRKITPEDNPTVAHFIRSVFDEMGIAKVGTAYEDVTLDRMFETYQAANTTYFVVEEEGELIGGAGIAPLSGAEAHVCELQKMYFSPKARGRGIGSEMITYCMDFAREAGYTLAYLETMPYMHAAKKLYAKTGFTPINGPMGDTGHYSCNVWMTKAL